MARANTVLLMQAADRLIAVIERMDPEVHGDALQFAIGWLASNGQSGPSGVHVLTWHRDDPIPVTLALMSLSLDILAAEGMADSDPAVRAEVVRLLDEVAKDATEATRWARSVPL